MWSVGMCSTNVYKCLLTTRTVHSRLETSEHPMRSNTFNERSTGAWLAHTRPRCHSPTACSLTEHRHVVGCKPPGHVGSEAPTTGYVERHRAHSLNRSATRSHAELMSLTSDRSFASTVLEDASALPTTAVAASSAFAGRDQWPHASNRFAKRVRHRCLRSHEYCFKSSDRASRP